MEETRPWLWWKSLGSPRLVAAPMVEGSELPFRELCRRHGAQLCYSPMFHAELFAEDDQYRKSKFTTCASDRPLLVQFCANKPETLLRAAQLVESQCDGVDLNLGCPQQIARRGHYGSFLQDEWSLISTMLRKCADTLTVPITAKFRVFPDAEKTVEYAKMLEAAGCSMICCHGRTREQKGRFTGSADWKQILAVKRAVSIPVIANGNILSYKDFATCLSETEADAVMTAEACLHDPTIFSPEQRTVWQVADDYMNLVDEFPTQPSVFRGHTFKILHFLLHLHPDFRPTVAAASNTDDLRDVISQLREHQKDDDTTHAEDSRLPVCWSQSRVRNLADWNVPITEVVRVRPPLPDVKDEEGNTLSKNARKRIRNGKALRPPREPHFICSLPNCFNVGKEECVLGGCKPCCRLNFKETMESCTGHGFGLKKVRGGLQRTEEIVLS